jgi:cytochrome c2
VKDLALERRGTNEHGPNLRGVATKVTREWLYSWVKDPTQYWPDTRMPDLRLSDQDAADIVAYMMDDPDGYFSDVPEGWNAALVAMPEAGLREVLAEQARWLFARDGRSVIEARLAGQDPARPWNDLRTLRADVGEKLVGQYGCFSCHEIEGMQTMMPIGTELSNWGSKTVDKLDFGFAYKKDLAGRPKLDHEYREGWLLRKLHAPRSFDGEKVKNPIEKLRMPYFAFTDEQAEAIATFVVGLVDDEVQRARMLPTPEQTAMDTGLRVVRQKNCMACHQVDPGTVTFEGEDRHHHTVVAELLPFEDELVPPAHDLARVQQDFEDLGADELGMRLLRPEPDLDAKFGERLFVPADKVRALSAPRGGDFVRVVTDYYYYGQELFDPEAESEEEAFYSVTADPDGEGAIEDVDGKFRAFFEEPYDKVRWTYAPPVLWDEGNKIQRQWFYAFLKDVVPLRHQVRVRMPSFTFRPGEAEAVADYFAHKAVREWPARFARELRLSQDQDVQQLAAASKLDARALLGMENGNPADTRANLDKLIAYAAAQGFTRTPPVDPAYEAMETRGHAYLTRRGEELPGHFGMAERIVTEAVNCYQCHFRLGAAPAAEPIAWAPDLALSHERLREEWVLDWLRDPQAVYPGTSMPANFASETPQYQAIYPDSDNADQLRLVLEWLFNFDRVYMATEN